MVEQESYIKLFRKFLKWEWYNDSKMIHLFIHLLISANYEDKKWHGVLVKRGQIIIGRRKLAATLGFSEMEIRTCLKRLQSTHEITINSTNKYSIITLCKYNIYQNNQPTNNQQTIRQITNEQPTNNQQTTTTKEREEIKKERKEEGGSKNIYDVEVYFQSQQVFWESLLMKTGKDENFAKEQLRTYHLFLGEKEAYPYTAAQARFGFEKWLISGKYFGFDQKEEKVDFKKNAWKYV